MVGQMPKVTLGCRAPWLAIGIALRPRLPRGLGFADSRFQILENQLALVRGQLLGPFAVKGMAQLGDEVILTFGLRLQSCDLGLHGCKRIPHGGRNTV